MKTKLFIGALVVFGLALGGGSKAAFAQGPAEESHLPYSYKLGSALTISPDTVTVGSEIGNMPTQEDMLRLLNYQLSESYLD